MVWPQGWGVRVRRHMAVEGCRSGRVDGWERKRSWYEVGEEGCEAGIWKGR